jgi:bifunctional DNase/RNase
MREQLPKAVALSCLLVFFTLEGCGGRSAAAAPAPAPAASARATPSTEQAAARRATREKPPEGYVKMVVGGVAPTPQGNAVLLSDERGTVGLPIFVGEGEALSILVRLRQHPFQRPLTHDLLDTIMRRLGGSIESVRVDAVKNNVFFATVLVRSKDRVFEVDSRASDAIALAVGNNAPIFVARPVIEQAGIDVRDLERRKPGPAPGPEPAPEGDPGHLKL